MQIDCDHDLRNIYLTSRNAGCAEDVKANYPKEWPEIRQSIIDKIVENNSKFPLISLQLAHALKRVGGNVELSLQTAVEDSVKASITELSAKQPYTAQHYIDKAEEYGMVIPKATKDSVKALAPSVAHPTAPPPLPKQDPEVIVKEIEP